MTGRLRKAWRRFRPIADCPYCDAFEWEDCKPECPMRACGECGGLGVVIDLKRKLGFDEESNPVYAGKPCPRCDPAKLGDHA